MFKYSDSNKRYHTLDYFYRHKFHCKVAKVSLNAGFTCPNIDGKVGTGGCIYCSKLGSGEFGGNLNDDLVTQFNKIKKIMLKKWPNSKFIGYFQAHTNTYAPVKTLKEKYETILAQDGVVGLNIATRADAITDECFDYLCQLNKKTFLTIELGLQTIHGKTSTLINRCHDLACFEQMVKKLKKHHINVVVHIINGLPYETREMMIGTVRYLNKLDIDGIKIHMLSVIKDTKLAKMYENHEFNLITREEYIDIVCDELEELKPEVVIHRITASPDKETLIEPLWLNDKITILNDIDKELKNRNSYQGKRLDK